MPVSTLLIVTLIQIGGVLAGLLLLRVVPVVRSQSHIIDPPPLVTVIVPARNEAENLPSLLQSLRSSAAPPAQILVVDDHSSDATAGVAASMGATVLPSSPLPAGWTGKTWACHQGAAAATGSVLLFLDADTCFTSDGYSRSIACFSALPANAALSILPFHRTRRWYEELSLFFNILIAMGAGGFGRLDPPHLFGPSLLIGRELYLHAGGHGSVKREILENLHLAAPLRAVGGRPHTIAGRGTIETRMFPEGFPQLRESWTKAFAAGAGSTSPLVLALSIFWLTAAIFTAFRFSTHPATFSAVFYLMNVVQIAWYARQLGSFRIVTAVLYPIPLVFYFVIFAQSLSLRLRHQPVSWRGRQL